MVWRTVLVINPIQARGGAHCAPYQNHSTVSKRLGVLSYCFVTFISMYFPFRKVQFHQTASCMLPWQPFNFFGIILKTLISIIFQVFPLERNFLWDNLCFGHHNTLRSLIEANIRSVTVERFQKIILPKYGRRL